MVQSKNYRTYQVLRDAETELAKEQEHRRMRSLAASTTIDVTPHVSPASTPHAKPTHRKGASSQLRTARSYPNFSDVISHHRAASLSAAVEQEQEQQRRVEAKRQQATTRMAKASRDEQLDVSVVPTRPHTAAPTARSVQADADDDGDDEMAMLMSLDSTHWPPVFSSYSPHHRGVEDASAALGDAQSVAVLPSVSTPYVSSMHLSAKPSLDIDHILSPSSRSGSCARGSVCVRRPLSLDTVRVCACTAVGAAMLAPPTPREHYSSMLARQKDSYFAMYRSMVSAKPMLQELSPFTTGSARIALIESQMQRESAPEPLGVVRSAVDVLDLSGYCMGDAHAATLAPCLNMLTRIRAVSLAQNRHVCGVGIVSPRCVTRSSLLFCAMLCYALLV